MDKDKIANLLGSLGISKEKMGSSSFDRLVDNLRGESNRSNFVAKINENKKYMGYKEISQDDLRRASSNVYYDLKG